MLLAWQCSAACLARGAGAPVVRPPRLLWSRHSQLSNSLLHIGPYVPASEQLLDVEMGQRRARVR